MCAPGNVFGKLRAAVLRRRLEGSSYRAEKKIQELTDTVAGAAGAENTMDLIRLVDKLYNRLVDPSFEAVHGNLEKVLAVSIKELTEYPWEDYLTEELYEEALESYMEQLTGNMTGLEDRAVTESMEEERRKKHKITVLPPEVLEKAHTYVELNYGKTYLTETEEKRINHLMCRGIHGDCSLYFTEGILKNPVKRNYQYEYAVRLR